MHLALVVGSWSSNIGNAFYNLGAEWLLRDIGCRISRFPESPRWKGNVDNYYDPVAKLKCDIVILNGPCLNGRLPYVYGDTFKALYARGVRVAYLSAGMSLYDSGEAAQVGQFLKTFPPYFICTRDRQACDLLRKVVDCPFYDGLCTSMFLNDAVQPLPIEDDPYLVLNFDGVREPELSFAEDRTATVRGMAVKRFPEFLLGLKVVRTCNLSIDEGYRKIYAKPNTYHSDLPRGYCSILKHAQIVYSERVHTCATALIYGTEVQYIPQSERAFEKRHQLFQRIGVGDIFKRPVRLDLALINQEKDRMRSFLKSMLV